MEEETLSFDHSLYQIKPSWWIILKKCYNFSTSSFRKMILVLEVKRFVQNYMYIHLCATYEHYLHIVNSNNMY